MAYNDYKKDEDFDLESESDSGDTVHDEVKAENVELSEDTYGMSVCALVRDSYRIARGENTVPVRIIRLTMTLFLLALTMFGQVFILAKVKQFVSARAVHDIRIVYDLYEKTIYLNDTTLTVNGYNRGIPEKKPPLDVMIKRLKALSIDDQDAICKIPLSQPYFFFSILLIWTLTCLNELRKCSILFFQVIISTNNVDSMTKALEQNEDNDDDDNNGGNPGNVDPSANVDPSGEVLIANLTVSVKVLLVLLVFAPWFGITIYLMWVGCRWLLATNDFADLILNAVALEFILMLKETVFFALMPMRNRVDLKKTFVKPYPEKEGLQNNLTWICMFMSALWYFVGASVWVILYMIYLQGVLPDYRWDVHEPCEDYIARAFKV